MRPLFAIFLLINASVSLAVDLTDVATLGAAESAEANTLYSHLQNLKPTKPLLADGVLLTTSIPSVILEKFGYPEVNLDARSKKIAFVIDRNGKLVWLYGLAGDVRYLQAKPLKGGLVGLLASGSKGSFVKLDPKKATLQTLESVKMFPKSKWGRDFAEYNSKIIIPATIARFYREPGKFFQEPREVNSGRLFEVGRSVYHAVQFWNPDHSFAPNFSQPRKSFNEIVSMDWDGSRFYLLFDHARYLVELNPEDAANPKIISFGLNKGEYLVHADKRQGQIAYMKGDGSVEMWQPNSKGQYHRLWKYVPLNVRSDIKRGSVVISENQSVMVFYAALSVVGTKRQDLLIELDQATGEERSQLAIPTLANPGGYRAYPLTAEFITGLRRSRSK